MHIASGLCSVSVCVAGAGLAAGALIASRWLGREQQTRLTPGALAALSAAVFAAQMLNMPVTGATSGHLVGGALLGILAGPVQGLLAMCVILATQSLLFADGGIAALGLNILNMGVVGVLGGWAIHRAMAGRMPVALSAGIAGFAVAVAGAALCAVELALSGPAPLGAALAAMTGIHALIGLLEAGVTALAIAALARPATAPAVGIRLPAAVAIAACAIAPFASSLPDGLDSTATQLGFASQATEGAAPFAGYLVPGMPEMFAVVLAGLIGAAIVASVMRVLPATRRI
jgi:cobalt/nickel transport system permease protein